MTDAEFIQLLANDDLDSSLHMYKQRGIRLQAIAQRLEADEWVSVADHLPECSKDRDSFGEAVLVYPPYRWAGSADIHQAFYGCRQTKEPNFYLYGAVFHPTHWKPLPKGPQ